MFHHRRTIPPKYIRSGRGGGFPPVNPRNPLLTWVLIWTFVGLVVVLAQIGWPALAAGVLAFLAWAWEEF